MDYSERAAQRRASWTSQRVAPHQLEQADRRFWQEASGSQRLDAVWQMALEMWSLKGEGPAPRLQGFAFGVRKLGS